MPDTPFNPCTDCASQGGYSRLLLSDSVSDFDSATRLRFFSEDLKMYRRKVIPQEITGDLGIWADLIRDSQSYVYGPIHFALSAGEADTLLPYMIGDLDGGTGGSGYYVPTSCLGTFHLLLKRDYGVFRYQYCRIASWSLAGRALNFQEESNADQIILTANIIAVDRDIDAISWPDPDPGLTIDDTMWAYYFRYMDVTLLGTERRVKRFQLTCDHNLRPRYRNSLTPTAICSYGRHCEMVIEPDWNDTNDDLMEQAASAACTLKFNGLSGRYTQFEFGNAVAVDKDPVAKSKYEDVRWEVRNIMGHTSLAAGSYDIQAKNSTTAVP